ncbi:hypothetical protein EYR40_001068 [Pleurotus pulmonarius]|nr:hypothetical protein EYR40_001068 [Pleurotus pulmonarius]
MFRQATRGSLRGALKARVYSTGQTSKRISPKVPGALLASALVASFALNSAVVYNDAPAEHILEQKKKAEALLSVRLEDQDGLNTIVWGSNKSGVLDPKATEVDSFRIPTVAAWLQNVALRDLALHKKHAACVDARGDVYQWGEGFSGAENAKVDGKPTLTLRGKNIISLQLTEGKLYALSASGKVYVLASDAAAQFLPVGKPTPASTPWWSTGWMWGEEEEVDFAEVTPNCQLAWGEKITSISAGEYHLLALTSAGRTFAHPVTKDANAYGQLGLRKLDVPDHSERLHVGPHAARKTIELVPKSITDPYAKSSPYIRTSTPSANQLEAIPDTSIRFCDRLYEIPSLKGIEIAQIAAGGRSSFARTSTGRVLGWGANEFGQIGLGNNYKLDTVVIPTEVVLWQYTSNKTTSQCLNVTAGGDLTCFAVERKGEENIDVLMCGNGQYGGLGNNLYTNSQGAPLRAKNVSGLQEYNEATKSLHAISPYSISVSPSGHVLLTLNADMNVGGRDLMVWGKNHDSELGNGKKGSSPLPSALANIDDLIMNLKEGYILHRGSARVRGQDAKISSTNRIISAKAQSRGSYLTPHQIQHPPLSITPSLPLTVTSPPPSQPIVAFTSPPVYTMSEPLSSPTLSSSSSSFDIPSTPTYDSDDEIVWSLSSSSISTGSSNDFVVLSRALSPSNPPLETPSPDSVSESSVSDLSSSVDSMSLSDVSASIPPQVASSSSPSLPLMQSRTLNVDYPTPTATPTPRTASRSAPALLPSAAIPSNPTKAQLKQIRNAAQEAQIAKEKQAKLERKAAAVAAEKKALAQKATAKARAAQAKAQVVTGKSLQQIASEKESAKKATKKARRARKSARKAEKSAAAAAGVAAKAVKGAVKVASALQAAVAKVKKPAVKVVQTAKKFPPASPKPVTMSVGLGSRPVIDDSAASEVASEKGDDPSSFAEASRFITSYINDPETAQTKSKVHRLALLQSIIVEFGVGTTSMLPRTITTAKAFVKSTVFVNVQDYLTVRSQGQEALKRILLPNKKALIKDIRRKGPTPRTLVKQHGLQALLVQTH